jgi:nicotinamidase-related amidase
MAWHLELGASALIVIDAQNDFLHPEGWYGTHGVDIRYMRRTIEPTRALAQSARAKRIPIIWTQHGFHNESDGGLFLEMRPFLAEGGLRIGTWGHQILEELEPAVDDWRIQKNRLSAFYGTNLELLLRGLGVRTVLVVGVPTNQCVAATSKDAY